jgi:hypothetical protein
VKDFTMSMSDIIGRIGEARYVYVTDTFHWDDIGLTIDREFGRVCSQQGIRLIGLAVDHMRAKGHVLNGPYIFYTVGDDLEYRCPEDGFLAIA